MSESLSLEKLIEYIESLSPETQASLFNQLHSRQLEKQRQDSAKKEPQTQKELETGNAACDILAAKESKYWGSESKGTYHVLIKNEPDGTVSAQVLGWADCKAIGATRHQAVHRLQELVDALLAEAEIVPVQIRSTQSENPWIRLAGKLKDNPLFDEVLGYMEAYRRELDEETEAYYRQLEAEEAMAREPEAEEAVK